MATFLKAFSPSKATTAAASSKSSSIIPANAISTQEIVMTDFQKDILYELREIRTTQVKMSGDIVAMRGDMSGLRSDLDKMRKEVHDTKSTTAEHDTRIGQLEEAFLKVTTKLEDLEGKTLKLESYSRKLNLIFEGVQTSRDQPCHEAITTVLRNNLHIAPTDVQITECHTVHAGRTPYPIYVRFGNMASRNKVMSAARLLKGTPFIIREDFPPTVAENRKVLYPAFRKAVQEKKTAKLSGDTLTIAGISYSVNNLPTELLPPPEKVSENVVAFFGERSFLSNFHPSKFTIDGTTFKTVEAYYQFRKAKYYGENTTATDILTADSPRKCKWLGNRLPRLPHTTLSQDGLDWMKRAIQAKFEQNIHLQDALLRTGTKTLGEASYDKFWGIGVRLDGSGLHDPAVWQGANHLGRILMEVRSVCSHAHR